MYLLILNIHVLASLPDLILFRATFIIQITFYEQCQAIIKEKNILEPDQISNYMRNYFIKLNIIGSRSWESRSLLLQYNIMYMYIMYFSQLFYQQNHFEQFLLFICCMFICQFCKDLMSHVGHHHSDENKINCKINPHKLTRIFHACASTI